MLLPLPFLVFGSETAKGNSQNTEILIVICMKLVEKIFFITLKELWKPPSLTSDMNQYACIFCGNCQPF